MSNALLKAQTALVTGASSGIGKAVAIASGMAGATVAVNYVADQSGAAAVVGEIIKDAGAHAIALEADVSSEERVQAMFAAAIKEFRTIDILVNNAGLQEDAPFADMTLPQWKKVISVNLTGQFPCAGGGAQFPAPRHPT